jgi:hypothetical protein
VFVEEPVSVTGKVTVGVTYSADLNVDGNVIGSGSWAAKFVRLEDGIVVECSKSESSVSVLDGGHD